MCGPLDSELMEDVRMIIKFNEEARLRGNYKAACMICHGGLQYVRDMSTGGLGSLIGKIMKDGEKTSVNDDPCNRANLALKCYIGLDKSSEAQQALEYYTNFPSQPYGSSCKRASVMGIRVDKGG